MAVKVNPLDEHNMYEVHRYDDTEHGDLIVRIPVTEHGEPDSTRFREYMGECNLTVSGHSQPVKFTFPIKALNMADALVKWASACSEAIDELESQQRRRQIIEATPAINGRLV